MKITTLPLGSLQANCYLLQEEASPLAALIDPGDESEKVLQLLEHEGAQVKYILLTHGHYDHTGAVPDLHAALPEAKIFIHAADADGTGNRLFPLASQIDTLEYYDEGEVLPLGNLQIHVLHTPGHSLGSVVLQVEDALFCGDTLFAGSCGRTDFPGGDLEQMMTSLNKLAALQGDYTVYSGHMSSSTLQRERDSNPYMQQAVQAAQSRQS